MSIQFYNLAMEQLPDSYPKMISKLVASHCQ